MPKIISGSRILPRIYTDPCANAPNGHHALHATRRIIAPITGKNATAIKSAGSISNDFEIKNVTPAEQLLDYAGNTEQQARRSRLIDEKNSVIHTHIAT